MNKFKYDSDKWITNLLCFYFIVIFFYGVIIKITFNNSILFKIKTFLPEVILCVICFLCLLRNKKYSYIGAIMGLYFIIVLCLNIFTSYSVQSFMMTVRDVYFPIVTGFLLSSINMSKESYYNFFRKMIIISSVAIVSGFVLGILQYIKGWKWTSAWYTGYSFWGVDNNSSIYIMTSGNRIRVPSIVGNNVKFAMYTFFQLLFLLSSYNEKVQTTIDKNGIKINRVILIILGFINIFISNNKTTLLISVFIFYMHFLKKMSKNIKILIGFLCSIVCCLTFLELYRTSDFFLSFFDRFSKWSIVFNLGLTYNLLIPMSTFNFAGNSVTTAAVLNYWDNTYLYFAFSYGLIGLFLILKWCINLYKKSKKREQELNNNIFVKYLTIFSAISALTTSIVLGRAFFNVFIITIAFISNKKKE